MAQAEINIGTIGHVDHGKTTLVSALTGVWADTHSEEKKRGITIKLGYADVNVYVCKCSEYGTSEKCKKCGGTAELLKKISFLDAPGHETLMATVIAASSVMDGALFVISANEKCPQPQTIEHLSVLEAAGISTVVIAQNKVDLVTKEQAKQNYKEIKAFLKGSQFENVTIIPVSASSGLNVGVLLQALVSEIKPRPKVEGNPLLYVARSFDVNKPGVAIEKIAGGVLGGSIVRGEFKQGDEIEIFPGITRTKKDKENLMPLRSKIVAIHAGKEKLEKATTGGLVGLSTQLDPALSRADSLVGCLVGKIGTLPKPLFEMTLELKPLNRRVEKFADTFLPNEPLVIGVGTATTIGFVTSFKKNKAQLKLKKSVCVDPSAKIAVMRRAGNRWHLYAAATLV
ncbi:MAG: translation initiation factor IF-2 subunit gamma [Candidatus Micrarchaeota archaeon]